MSFMDRLSKDMKDAMRAKASDRLSAIRMVISAIKNKQIDEKRELSDEEMLAIVASDVKKRKDAASQFADGGRQDLVEEEEKGIAILTEYLPKQMGEDDVKAIVKEAVTKTGASSMKDMGAVMKAVMPEVKGKADGGLVNRLVKEALS